MNDLSGRSIFFDEFEIDLDRRCVLRAGESLPVNPKAFDLLLVLLERPGSPVSKTELLDRVWPRQFVEENNLTVHISALRKLLGEKKNELRYIITVPGRGYKFIGELRDHAAVGAGREDSVFATGTTEDVTGHGSVSELVGPPEPVVRQDMRWLAAVLLLSIAAAGFLLWRASVGSPDVPVKSIAILPFKPLVSNDRDEALELGISDSLISRFSRLQTLTVRPMSAVRRYSALDQDALAAGRELGVESVLDGNIQRTGERLRISARLVRTHDGATLWTETFDENFTDIFEVQDSIAQKIISALSLRLSGDEQRDVVKKYTDNTEAYSLYLKGRFFWSKLTPDDLRRSVDLYLQAISVDHDYALAYAGLSDSYNLLGSYGFWPLKESHPKARAAAEKALAIDGELAEAHASLAAVIADYYWDWAMAERHFRKAIELNPNYSVARYWFSQYLARMGRLDESIGEARRAQTLDPVSSSTNSHVGLALYRARRFDEAIAELQKALELDRRALDARLFLGFVYIQQRKWSEGIAQLETAVDLSGRNAGIVALLGYGYAASGRRDNALAILKEMNLSSYPLETALIYIGLDDHDRAFEWLERAYAHRSWQLGFLKIEPLFDPLRDDPRFAQLIRRMNLPP